MVDLRRAAAAPSTNGPKSSCGGIAPATSTPSMGSKFSPATSAAASTSILPQASKILRELLPNADRRSLIPLANEPPVRF